MLFNSLSFLVFAPIFYLLYFTLEGRKRLLWCSLASYFFYAWWDWRFVGLLFGSSLVAFCSGKMIGQSRTVKTKKAWLWFCILSHLGALGFFKYFGFCADSLKTVFHWLGVNVAYQNPGIVLPIGISFFTFTALSYTIDVYRGKLRPEADFLVYATYECLFPHLVAGPILRASKFIPQLKIDHRFDWAQAGRGLEMIAWGYLLKMCLADNAALFADPRFEQPELFTSASLALAVIAFAFQIYGDFAGYSLIAIGLARVMGYDFGTNFNKPYFAVNFSDFWQRWHMSLSSWIRDYLYIPLGGNECGPLRNTANLIITMFLGGLWHGAGWNYVIWGLLHGFYLVGQRVVSKPFNTACELIRCPQVIANAVSIATVFILTCIAWVFFRTKTAASGFDILKAIFSWHATAHLSFGGMKYQLLRVSIIVFIVLIVDSLSSWKWIRSLYQEHTYGRVAFAGGAVVFILFMGSFAANSFIYFQF